VAQFLRPGRDSTPGQRRDSIPGRLPEENFKPHGGETAMFTPARIFGGAAAVGALLLLVSTALAAPKYDSGASDTEIKIGNTMPYSGPVSAYSAIGRAFAAYFDMVNDQGGINGRKIKFISYDDGYSPPKTVEQVRRLVEQDRVLLLFGNLGTPTNLAILEYVNQQRIPHLFVMSGSSKLDDPEGHPWTIPNTYASFRSMGAGFAGYVLRHHPGAKIGILSQNDDFGRDHVLGFKETLGKANLGWIVSEQTYEVSDPTVDSQVVALKASGATVFLNASSTKAAAQSIRKMAEIGWKPVHFLSGASATIDAVFKPAGLENSIGIISGLDVDKDIGDPQWADDPGVRDYRAWLARYNPRANPDDWMNVWGYNNAQALVHVLKQAGDDLTRANIMKVATSLQGVQLTMQLPGVTLNTSPADHSPVEEGYLTRFDGAREVQVELWRPAPVAAR
jgi:branched-chain amino acid transport system substrate-binding protein